MTAGLETEPGPEVVEVLLEPAALLADGGARQPAQAAREEPHADPSRMEVRRREHPIGAHPHLPVGRHETASRERCQGQAAPRAPAHFRGAGGQPLS